MLPPYTLVQRGQQLLRFCVVNQRETISGRVWDGERGVAGVDREIGLGEGGCEAEAAVDAALGSGENRDRLAVVRNTLQLPRYQRPQYPAPPVCRQHTYARDATDRQSGQAG